MRSNCKIEAVRVVRILVLVLFIIAPRSCIKDFPETFPTSYEWKPLLAFPIGWAEFGIKAGQGFDTLLSQVDTLGVPAWANLPAIPFSGNILFDFEDVLGQRDEVQTVQLRVNAYNGFPVDIEIQCYLYNEQGVVIDSLFNPSLILARGTLSGGGETVLTSVTRKDILFDEVRLDLLVATKEIGFVGEISNVDYFPEYTFEVQLAAIMGIVSEFSF